MRSYIEGATDELLPAIERPGEVDLLEAFSSHGILGLSIEDGARVQQWSAAHAGALAR